MSPVDVKNRLLEDIEAQKDTYGKFLFSCAIEKKADTWYNVLTKIVPLYKDDSPLELRKFEYEKFVLIEEFFSLDQIKEFVNKLSDSSSAIISLAGYEVEFYSVRFSDGEVCDSSYDNYDICWPFKRYKFANSISSGRIGPLFKPDLPLFVDSHDVIYNCLKVDVSNAVDYGVLFCLPNYSVRIKEVKVGPTELSIKIENRALSTKDFYAKVFCENGKQIRQEDIIFNGLIGRVNVGFRPEVVYVLIASKIKNELLDKRQFHSSWRIPKDVVIDIPEFEIRQLIEQGESDTLEFKRQIDSRPGQVNEKIIEAIVAFSNTKGGIILIGVDDDGTVYGLTQGDTEERIRSIVRSHCVPEPKLECTKRSIADKEILFIRIEEGYDKPYTVWQKGPFIRAGSTVRIAERYELDQLQKRNEISSRGY